MQQLTKKQNIKQLFILGSVMLGMFLSLALSEILEGFLYIVGCFQHIY